MKENRKILIFSRYTATTSSIENELYTCFPHLSIGRYDGDCIRIRKSGKSFSENVTKEVLVNQLNNGGIDLVICSDAASEGLNLQSASAVINVDVPWNPARVMQRIGRVDRLGQLSPSVLIHNLVYIQKNLLKVKIITNDSNIKALERSLQEKTGLQARIHHKKNNKGILSFEYNNTDQLDRLVMVIKANY